MIESIQHPVDGVVSDDTWFSVPEIPQYVVTKNGKVGKLVKDKIIPISIQETKTSVGTYLTVNITVSFKQRKQFGVHQLVADTFIPKPKSFFHKYEVNHKDGNKHNNHYTNLEWVTRSENTLHALMNGLRDDNLEVTATNFDTGEKILFYSIIEVSRYFNVPRNTIKRFISKHCYELFNGCWRLHLDLTRLDLINRPHHAGIKAWDYIDQKEIAASNATNMYYMTGIHSATILLRIKNNVETMIGGYVFKYSDDDRCYHDYSLEDAKESRYKYFTKYK